MKKYSGLLRINHWLSAVVIVLMLCMGFYMVNLSNDHAIKFEIYKVHKQIGILFLVLVVFRLIVRFVSIVPEHSKRISPKFILLSKIVQVLLYCLMLLMPISGYVMSYASGRSVSFFFMTIPSIISRSEKIAGIANGAHYLFSITLAILLVMHIVGTIWHIIIDKENLLKRIL